MSTIFLHNFAASPFGEKVRLILGLKSLQWKSVDAELVMPKPNLTALTGGYRKTPVMQIGADIYCDSRLISDELEERYSHPTIYPGGSRGLCVALSEWSDRPLHISSSGLAIGVNKRDFPMNLMADRKRFFEGFIDIENIEAEIPHLKSQLRAHAALIEEQLSDGRRFWLGEEPSLADFHAYVEIWTVRAFVPSVTEILRGFRKMEEWENRVKQIGHGEMSLATVEEAHEAAQVSTGLPGRGVEVDNLLGLSKDDLVTVIPDDYGKEPVVGRLVTLSLREVAVKRDDALVGKVTVHFPRIGYRIIKA
jgi:glutathione S-transferase